SSNEALKRVEPERLITLLRPTFDPIEKERAVRENRLVAEGLNASPGAASGRVVFNAEDAVARAAAGEPVILVRIEPSPEDIRGMNAAQGILTARGGMTSHAAVVAGQMGKVCVAGCDALLIDYRAGEMRITGRSAVVREGEFLSIDGSTGEVFLGRIATIPSEIVRVLIEKTLAPADAPTYQLYAQLMKWADKARRLRVRANADQPDQGANAAALGVPFERVRERVEALHEFNPMLGFRGCRLGIVYPEITEMQARAIFEAAADVRQAGVAVEPEIMIPLVGHVKELALEAAVVRRV